MPRPKGKHMFGTVKVGEKGQIVIPKEARDLYKISSGDSLLVLGDEKGIAILKSNVILDMMERIMGDDDSTEREKKIAGEIMDTEGKGDQS